MQNSALNPEQYIQQLPPDRQEPMKKLREAILANLSEGFDERISHGMISYVVPHSVFQGGYHCDPMQPLPFISIASQKNFIAVYHLGIYADKDLYDWFVAEYPKYVKTKLDMGKSCIRFKKPDSLPFKLIGELVSKMSASQWIQLYEKEALK